MFCPVIQHYVLAMFAGLGLGAAPTRDEPVMALDLAGAAPGSRVHHLEYLSDHGGGLRLYRPLRD